MQAVLSGMILCARDVDRLVNFSLKRIGDDAHVEA
jgi:hypothetical protein